jgi:hypothetical protein
MPPGLEMRCRSGHSIPEVLCKTYWNDQLKGLSPEMDLAFEEMHGQF